MKNLRAAFKFCLFVATTLGLYSVWFVAAFFRSKQNFGWRQTIFGLWARAFVKIANMRVRVVGVPPRPPFFLVSNHLSYMDVAALRSVVKGVFVAKGEIANWFLAGRICRDMGAIYINRQNRRDIPRAGGEIIERLNAGEGVIVFPEGTSTKGESILPFNSSFLEFAARSDLPVSYASIRYETAGSQPSAGDVVCWWEDISFGAHLFRLFKLRGFTAIINFGDEPVSSSDRKELARVLRQKVAENFVPVV